MPGDHSPRTHRDPAESVHRDLIREFVDVFAWRRARERARSSLATGLADAG
jgi:hypothetical protein